MRLLDDDSELEIIEKVNHALSEVGYKFSYTDGEDSYSLEKLERKALPNRLDKPVLCHHCNRYHPVDVLWCPGSY